jgi:NitT/TauT family transport system substrate-binding protein/putative hydroxymethylpyrimidine transport system substrate-binding protein
LQCDTHVRDSDSVTLREKVTRRLTTPSLRPALRSPESVPLRPRPPIAALAAVLTVALAGCGGSTSSGGVEDAALMLDFTPNAVHSGIYTTVARDFDGAEGVRLRIRQPSETTDSIRLLESGKVQFAILSISDLALARAKGAGVRGVMAIVQRPLAAVFARPGIRSPRDLEGERAGVAGLPSDTAVLESVVRGAGGDPEKVRRTNIGFTAVPALVGGRVDAVTAFWNVEGLALKDELPGVREFRVDRFGAPAYPELVLCTTTAVLQDDPDVVEGTVQALRRGYDEVLIDPEVAAENMLRRAKGLDRETVLRELRAVQPAFKAGVGAYGELRRDRLDSWATWAQEFGLVDEKPVVDELFVTRFATAE